MQSIDALRTTASGASTRVFAALAEEDWDRAAEIAVATWGPLVSFHPDVLSVVCESAPADRLATHPEWIVLRSYLRQLLTRPDLRPVLYTDDAPAPASAHGPMTRAMLVLSRVLAARTEGDYERAATLATEAERLARGADPDHPATVALMVPLLLQCAFAHEFAPHPEPAARLLGEVFRRAEAAGDLRGAIAAAGELGWLLALTGDGATADDWLDTHETLRDSARTVHARVVSGRMGRALRHGDGLDLTAAQAVLDETDPDEAGEHRLLLTGLGVLVGARGADDLGGALLSRFDSQVMGIPLGGRSQGLNARFSTVIRSEVLALRGDAAAALRAYDGIELRRDPVVAARLAGIHLLLEDEDAADALARETIESAGFWPRAHTESVLIRAAVALRRGDRERAADLFREGLAATAANRSSMPLAYLPMDDLGRLAELLPPAERPAGLDVLLAGRIALLPSGQRSVRPTPGELRLLRALAVDTDEQRLAATLGVSRNTVRTQLHTLYRKFGVNSRAALRAAARREGLL